MPAGFWLLDVMFCSEWVELILCCSGSNGATHRNALPSSGWGLSALSKSWCDGKSQAGRGSNTIFVSKANVSGSELFPPGISSHPCHAARVFPLQALGSCIAVLSYRIFLHARLVGRHWWVLDWGDLGALSKGCPSADNSSFELYMLMEKSSVLGTGCSYLLFVFIYLFIAFTPVESNIVTHSAFFLSGQSSKKTGGNAVSFLSFDLFHHSLVPSKLPKSSMC